MKPYFSTLEFFRRHCEIPGEVRWGILEIKEKGESAYHICIILVDEPDLCVIAKTGLFVGERDLGSAFEIKIHPAQKIERDGYFEITTEEEICHGEQFTFEGTEEDFECWYRYKVYSPKLREIKPLP